jgi:endonuclease/exonuclease/phosphatase family metal-dependent hydrolase
VTVRVVTWNLWWRFGPWRDRARAIEQALAACEPDLVLLQEVWAGPVDPDGHDGHQGERLAAALGLAHTAWSPNRSPQRWRRRVGADGEGVDVGLAVLSRWPLRQVAEHPLDPGGVPDEGRTALAAVVEHPLGAWPVVTTHLTSHPAHSGPRVEQVRGVARVLADLTASAGRRTLAGLVAGDFNAEPESDEMRLMSGLLTAPPVPGQVLVDAWRMSTDGDPGWTWRRENGYLGPGNPDARIDHVLVGLRARVLGTGLVGDRPVDVDGEPVWPSDHAGVVVDLDLGTGITGG